MTNKCDRLDGRNNMFRGLPNMSLWFVLWVKTEEWCLSSLLSVTLTSRDVRLF